MWRSQSPPLVFQRGCQMGRFAVQLPTAQHRNRPRLLLKFQKMRAGKRQGWRAGAMKPGAIGQREWRGGGASPCGKSTVAPRFCQGRAATKKQAPPRYRKTQRRVPCGRGTRPGGAFLPGRSIWDAPLARPATKSPARTSILPAPQVWPPRDQPCKKAPPFFLSVWHFQLLNFPPPPPPPPLAPLQASK